MPVLNIVPKTTLSFSVNALPNGQVVTQPMALNIPCGDYREATLLLRVHSFTGAAGAKVEAQLFNSAPTAEDPAAVFRAGAFSPTGLASVSWASGLPPTLAFGTVSAGLGESLDVLVSVTQATAATTIAVAISIDLALKAG